MKKSKGFPLDVLKASSCWERNKHKFEYPPTKNISRRAKFNNEKVEYDGKKFDSKKEYYRYRELLILQKKGIIAQLSCQTYFELIAKTETTQKCVYRADFSYKIFETGQFVVEDVKSPSTRKLSTYVIKKKLMKTIYNIDIKEI